MYEKDRVPGVADELWKTGERWKRLNGIEKIKVTLLTQRPFERWQIFFYQQRVSTDEIENAGCERRLERQGIVYHHFG